MIKFRIISPVAQATLKKIAKRYSGRVLVSERMANDTQIAMASWGRLDKMTESTFDEDYALRFIKKYTNKSPEKFVLVASYTILGDIDDKQNIDKMGRLLLKYCKLDTLVMGHTY